MSQSCSTLTHTAPLGVMWKTVSEDCNLACDYCYYSRIGGKIEGKVKRIESNVLDKFIQEYMKMSNGTASFAWQGGEPLLAGLDFFEEVVHLQAKYAPANTVISNSLQTNATLLNDEWATFLKKYNFLVGVSIDGPREVHDKRRVTRSHVGSFDRVMRGVDHLRKHNVDFNVLTVLHEDNINRASDLMTFYEQEGFQYVQFIPCMDFRAQETNKAPRYLITPEEYGQFLCDAFDLWYNDASPKISIRFFDNMLSVYVNQEAELCVHRKTCPKTLVLEQNGDAYPCDFFISDDYKLGNVGIDTLEDILGNYVYGQFLSKKPTLPEKCHSCDFLSLCHGGCPRNRAWSATSDEVDPDYFCESYLQVYRYADNRMQNVARRVRARWLQQYLAEGNHEPGRNDKCFCGSGNKYKKCCGLLRGPVDSSRNASGMY